MTEIRQAAIEDVDRLDAIRTATFPWHCASVETQRNWFQTVPEAAQAQRLVAVVDEVVAGFAYGGLQHTSPMPGQGEVTLMVHPDFQGRGIGRALYEPTEAHLRSIGVQRAQSYALDSPEVLAWAARQGYEPGASERWSMLDPANLPPVPVTPPNVTLMSLAEAGTEAAYAIDSESFLDEPGDVPGGVMPFQEWKERFWDSPGMDHEASMAAFVDGKPASMTLVEVNRKTGRAMSAGTGTVPQFRGLGLAKLLKSVSLRRAAEAGVTAAFTCNDYTNAPMLAINDWLGYKVIGESRSVLKSL